MPLASILARATQRGALVNGHVVAHLRRLPDDNAHAMVNEYAAAQLCSGVDLYTGEKPYQRRHKPPQPFHVVRIQPMCAAMPAHRVKAGIV